MSAEYRQEIVCLSADACDLIGRHPDDQTLPMPPGLSMDAVIEAAQILNDSSWEVVGVTDRWIYMRRYVEGQYAV